MYVPRVNYLLYLIHERNKFVINRSALQTKMTNYSQSTARPTVSNEIPNPFSYVEDVKKNFSLCLLLGTIVTKGKVSNKVKPV